MPFNLIYLSGDKDTDDTVKTHCEWLASREYEDAKRAEIEIANVKEYCKPRNIPAPRFRIKKIVTAAWEEREAKRLEDGAYKPLPDFITNTYWWRENKSVHAKHFAHLADKDDTKIAFTESPEKGEENKKLILAPTVYLSRYFSHALTQRDIRDIGALFLTGTLELKMSFSPDDFERIYEGADRVCGDGSSGTSCMRYNRTTFDTPRHPAYAYGAGDLAIAWIEDDDMIYGRAVIWPEKKTYVRVYGNNANYQSLMHTLLKREGYSHVNDFEGARLLKIKVGEENNSTRYLMPYLDNRNSRYLLEQDGHFVMTTDRDNIYADTTSGGILVFKYVTCAKTGDKVRANRTRMVDGEIWGERAFVLNRYQLNYCEYSGEYTQQPVVLLLGLFSPLRVKQSIFATLKTFRCDRFGGPVDAAHHKPMEVHTPRGVQTWASYYRGCCRKSTIDGKFYAKGYYPDRENKARAAPIQEVTTPTDGETSSLRYRPETPYAELPTRGGGAMNSASNLGDANWQQTISIRIDNLARDYIQGYMRRNEEVDF